MNEKKYQQHFVNDVINQNFQNEILLNLINPIGKLSPENVLKVYAEDYQYRLLEAMQSAFESVWTVLGDEKFKEFVFEYITKNPSTLFDLNLYGKNFPQFLADKESLQELIFLTDLSNFEINYWSVFHAENLAEINYSEEMNDHIFNSHLILNQSLSLFCSEYDVFELFKNRKLSSEEFYHYIQNTNINKPTFYIIFKKNSLVQVVYLSKSQYLFFKNISEKKSILDVMNLDLDTTQEETLEIFKIISSSLLGNLKEV